MLRFLIKRLIGLVPLFIGITCVSFAVMRLAPGNPLGAAGDMNPKMTVEARARLETLYGLNKPVWMQYADWAGRAARLDFGRSFVDGEKALDKIGRTIPVTLLVNGFSLLVIFIIGIPLGIAGAVHAGKWPDKVLSGAVLAGYSIPTFWLALILMSFFGVHLKLLPVSGLYSLTHDEMTVFEKIGDVARHLVLPLLVASITGFAGISRFMRESFLRTLKENYILTARAKGLPENQVLYGHALKNALLPVITLLGLSVPGLLGGSVIYESIFSIPGMGRLFFNSVFARDYPVIMGILVIGAVLTLLGNLLADTAYHLADPRVRLERAES